MYIAQTNWCYDASWTYYVLLTTLQNLAVVQFLPHFGNIIHKFIAMKSPIVSLPVLLQLACLLN